MSGARQETTSVDHASSAPTDDASRHVRFTSSVAGGDDTIQGISYRSGVTPTDSATESCHTLVQPSVQTEGTPAIQSPPMLNTRNPPSPLDQMPRLRIGKPALPINGGSRHKFWKHACCCCYFCFTDCCEHEEEESQPPVFMHGRGLPPVGIAPASVRIF